MRIEPRGSMILSIILHQKNKVFVWVRWQTSHVHILILKLNCFSLFFIFFSLGLFSFLVIMADYNVAIVDDGEREELVK